MLAKICKIQIVLTNTVLGTGDIRAIKEHKIKIISFKN